MKDYAKNKTNMKGGKSMVEIKKSTLIWIAIGVLLIATIFLAVKSSSIGATASAAKTAASAASSQMVGGC